MAKRDVLTASGNDMLLKQIRDYWKERGYTVNVRAVIALDLPKHSVYGIRSDLGLYMPRASKRA